MKRTLAKQLTCASRASLSQRHAFCTSSEKGAANLKYSKDDPEFSYGLNSALAQRGVIAKGKVFYNFKASEIKKTEQVFGVPLYIRGNSLSANPNLSRSQFSNLLKQVSCHLSSVPNIYVQDGTIGTSNKYNAKVRVIGDNLNAVYSFNNILWKASIRDINHDNCPLIIYIANSISSNVKEILGKVTEKECVGFGMADIERSSLILCGKACAAFVVIKDALNALASPVLFARGAIPLSARLLAYDNSVNLLFAHEDIIKSNKDLEKYLISTDNGVIVSNDGFAPFFPCKDFTERNPLKNLSSLLILSSDSTGGLQLISKLAPNQAAYHFLSGYNDGKFCPGYNKGPFTVDPLALAISLFYKIKEQNIHCFLINTNVAGKLMTSEEMIQLVKSALNDKLPQCKLAPDIIVENLKGKYKSFLLGKFRKLPEEFYF